MMQMFARPDTDIPHPVILILVCDGDHGLFPAPSKTFDVSHGFPRDIASDAGWKITHDGPVLCPECTK